MGIYHTFKIKHNLNTSSIGALAQDLEIALGIPVIKTLRYDSEFTLAKQLNLDTSIYEEVDYANPSNKSALVISDDYFIARELIKLHGVDAQSIIRDYPEEQQIINEINDINKGVTYFSIEYMGINSPQPEIYGIGKETLQGSPDFPGKWSLYRFLFEDFQNIYDDAWQDFIESRETLYNYLKPLIKELPVYYHADEGAMGSLENTDSMDEFEEVRVKHNLNLFNLSNFILNPNFSSIPNAYETIFVDDFKDILHNK